MNQKIFLVLTVFLCLFLLPKWAEAQQLEKVQGVSISEDTLPPNESAILDVRSTLKGMLIPRMTKEQRNAINPSSTEGVSLLVYVTSEDEKGFWFWDGSSWKILKPVEPGYPIGSIISYVGDPNPNLNLWDASGKGIGTNVGWAICNGQNGTPDLRGMFIVGADTKSDEKSKVYNVVNQQGGKSVLNLTEDQLPSHNHVVNDVNFKDFSFNHTHTVTNGSTEHSHKMIGTHGRRAHGDGAVHNKRSRKVKHQREHGFNSSSVSIKVSESAQVPIQFPENTIQDTGKSADVDNRPPYFVVLYIMRISDPNTVQIIEQNYKITKTDE